MPSDDLPLYVAVIGPGEGATTTEYEDAKNIGQLLAEAGHVVITGGLSGVMAGACEGAHSRSGTTVGLLPGNRREEGNPFLTVAVPTGLGELRNGLVIRSADAVICIGGSWGTLSEVGMAMRTEVPVVLLRGAWEYPPGPIEANSPAEAVALATEAALGMALTRMKGTR